MKKKNAREVREENKKKRLQEIQEAQREKEIKVDMANRLPTLEESNTSLNDYYVKKYGEPGTRDETIELLFLIYEDLMGGTKPEECIKEGIAEYFRMIEHRGLPAYEWLLEAFHVTSKKNSDKRNFNYIVGMVRNWMKFGFGHIPNSEEGEVMDYFEEVTESVLTVPGRRVMEHLMGKFGAIRVTRMICKLDNEVDVSLLKAEMLKGILEENTDIGGSNHG